MIVTIHQPDFLPWLGFFDRWSKSDLFIILDDVQFLRRGWHHRDRIKTATGAAWLTVPVQKKGKFFQTIREVRVDDQCEWQSGMLESIRCAYQKSHNFARLFPLLQKAMCSDFPLLMDLNVALLNVFAGLLNISTPVAYASTFNVQATKSERLVCLVQAVGGNAYLTGQGSKGYLDENIFRKAGIEVLWQNFLPPVYPQLHGAFATNLSALDPLMMVPECDWPGLLKS